MSGSIIHETWPQNGCGTFEIKKIEMLVGKESRAGAYHGKQAEPLIHAVWTASALGRVWHTTGVQILKDRPETAQVLKVNNLGKDGYVPAIDGMRALAITTVVASHFGAEQIVPGGFGVTVFFFISGYLITSLMIQEHSRRGRIAIVLFYIRRFLRLAPALLVSIAAVSVTFFLAFGFSSISQIFAAVFYYMNYYVIFGGSTPLPLGPLWSLAVEEHYYCNLSPWSLPLPGRNANSSSLASSPWSWRCYSGDAHWYSLGKSAPTEPISQPTPGSIPYCLARCWLRYLTPSWHG